MNILWLSVVVKKTRGEPRALYERSADEELTLGPEKGRRDDDDDDDIIFIVTTCAVISQ